MPSRIKNLLRRNMMRICSLQASQANNVEQQLYNAQNAAASSEQAAQELENSLTHQTEHVQNLSLKIDELQGQLGAQQKVQTAC